MHELGVENRGAGGAANRVVAERDELVAEHGTRRSRPTVTAMPPSRPTSSVGWGRFRSWRYTIGCGGADGRSSACGRPLNRVNASTIASSDGCWSSATDTEAVWPS